MNNIYSNRSNWALLCIADSEFKYANGVSQRTFVSKAASKLLLTILFLFCLGGTSVFATAWRTNANGNVNTLANWRDVATGASTPANFTATGDTWTIQNTMTQSATWTVAGNVTLSSGSWNAAASAINFGGNFTNNVSSGAFTSTGTTTFNGTAAQTIGGSAATTFGNLTINNAAGISLSGVGCSVSGNLALSAGTLADGGSTISVQGNVTGSGTHSSTGSGKISLTGISTTISGATFGNLQLNAASASAFTLSASPTINGALTFTGANNTLVIAANTLTLKGTVAGMSATKYLTGNGATSNLTINSTSNLGTLFFDPTTPGTSDNIKTFTMNSTGFSATLGNDCSVLTTLALTAGTLNDGGNTITCSGNITGAGTHASTGSGMISMTGTTKSIGNSTGTLGNLELNCASTTAYTMAGNITITGALIFTGSGNKLTIGAHTLTLNGSVSAMSSTECLTGSSTSNITVGAAGAFGPLFFNQTTINTTNKIATFIISGGGTVTLGNNLVCQTALTLTSGKMAVGTGNTLTVNGTFTGSSANYITGSATSNMVTAGTSTYFFDQTTAGTTNNFASFTAGTGTTTLGNNLSVSTTLTITGTLADGGNVITCSGNIAGTGTHSSSTGGKISMTGTGSAISGVNLGNLEFNAASASAFMLTGSPTVNGSLTFTGANNTFALGTQTLTLKGTVAGMSATKCLTGNGASSKLTINSTSTLGTLFFDPTTPGTTDNISVFTMNSSGFSATLGNNCSVLTTLALTAGTLNDGGNVIACAGNITGAGIHVSGAGGKISMTGAAKSISNSTATLGNLELNHTGATAFTMTGNPTITGALTFTAAANTLTIGAHTLTLNGSVVGMSGTQYLTGSSTSNITVGATGSFGPLFLNQTTINTTNKIATFLVNAGGTVTLGNNIVCQTALTLTSGKMIVGAGNTLTVNGAFTGSAANYIVGSATSNMVTAGTNTYYFDQTTPATTNNFASFTAGAGTTTLGNNLSVGTTLTLTGTLADGGKIVTLAGNIAGAGTHTSTGSGKITMTGIAKTISAATLGNLELNASSTSAFALSGNATIAGAFTFTGANNTLSIGAFTLNLNGTVAGMSATKYLTGNGATSNLTIASGTTLGTLFFDPTTPGTSDNIKTFTMNSSGFSATLGNNCSVLTTLALTAGTLNDGGHVITCAGNITGAGTHASSAGGKISMTGTAKSISNNTATLGNLDLNCASATAYTMTGNPTITGALSYSGAGNTLTIGAHTLTLNGTVSGMSSTQYLTGSATSNLTIGATGALGTIFLNQNTVGTTNKIATFSMTGGGSATLGNNMVCLTSLTLTAGKLIIGAGNTLTVNGTATGGASGYLTGSATSNLVTGTSGTFYFDQTTAGTTNNISTLTVSAGSPTLGNSLSVSTALALTGTLADGGNAITCSGNITGTGTESGTGGVTMTTSGATISGATIQKLTLNNSGGFGLTGSPTISGTLTLTSGKLTLGTNNITFGTAATAVAGTPSSSNMIVAVGTGKAIKSYSSNGAYTFPIGDATNYTPVTLNVTGTYTGASMAVNVTASKPVQNANTTNYINRYWTVTPTGITSLSYSVTATYVVGDVQAGSTELNIAMGAYAGALPWIKFGTESSHVLTSGAVTATGATIFSGINNVAGPFPTVSASTRICGGGNTPLSAVGTTGDAPLVYTWAPAAGLSATTGISVTASPTVTTTYTLTVTDANAVTARATSTVTVGATPTSTGATNNSPVCLGASITLSDHSSNATVWSWSGPSSYTSSIQSPSLMPTVTGVYSLTVSDGSGNPGCTSGVYTTTVSVSAQPAISLLTSSATSPICAASTMTLTATASGGTGTATYTWRGPGIATTTGSSSISPSFTPTATTTGVYSVSLAYSGTGCTTAGASTGTYSVVARPTVASVTANITSLCANGSFTLTAGAVTGTGTLSSYDWTGPTSYSSTTGVGVASVVVTPTVAATGAYSLTVTYPGTGCRSTVHLSTAVTVNAMPSAAPVNNGPVCAAGTVTLTATPGANTSKYTWRGPSSITTSTSQNPTITPTVTGVYSLTVGDGTARPGCSPAIIYTTSVAVNPQPTVTALVSSATTPICAGSTMTLTATVTAAAGTPNYTWSGPGIAVTTSATNISPSFSPTASATGAYSVTVNFTGSCPTGATGASGAYTVAPLPTVGGVTSSSSLLCTNGTFSLTAGSVTGPGGGTLTSYNWSGPNSYTSTGVVNQVVLTPTVSAASGVYSLSVTYSGTGCTSTTSVTSPAVTVNALPAAITGNLIVCGSAGNITNLTDAVAGGIWSSSATGVATVGSTTGAVTSVSAGTATIQYAVPGCTAVTATVTANAVVAGLCECSPAGSLNCSSGRYISEVSIASTTLDNISACGGGWSVFPFSAGSSTTANLSIPSTQNVSVRSGSAFGVDAIEAFIDYDHSNSFDASEYVSVTTNVNAANTVFNGSVVVPSGATAGLTTMRVRYIGAGGTNGSGTGCTSTGSALGETEDYTICLSKPTTITVPPASVTNSCIGGTPTLSMTVTGSNLTYQWYSSASTAVTGGTPISGATNSTYVADASGAGSSYYYCVLNNVCGINTTTPAVVAATVSVNAVPTSSGATNNSPVCAGSNVTLSDNSSNATTWSWTGPGSYTSALQSPTITPTVTGVYSLMVSSTGSGCNPATVYTTAVTVNPQPGPISGSTSLCNTLTTTLTDAVPGGVWASSDPSVATIGTDGTVTGTGEGTSVISYSIGSCASGIVVTVNPYSPITGTTFVCAGSSVDLTDATAGGTWTSSNNLIATIGSGTGTVTGVSAGIVTVTYVLGMGCSPTMNILVSPLAAPIAGSTNVCVGNTSVLSDATTGGSWTTSDITTANISLFTGVVTGVAAGTATITYSLGSGCNAYSDVTVNASPAAITGANSMCVGDISNLSDADAGGAWSSADPSVASVDAVTGIAMGLTTGTTRVTYTLPTGCVSTRTVSVNTLPATVIVSGSGNYCVSTTITATNGNDGTIYFQGATSGGTSTSTPSMSQLITFSGTYYFRALSATGCWGPEGNATVTISSLPSSITGTATVCIGSTTNLTDADAGGTWSSSAPARAAVGPSTGVVTGVSAGTAIITYTAATGCTALRTVTVNAISAINGASALCAGTTTTLTNSTGSGTWTSSNTSTATIGSSTGVVSGLAFGTTNITYTSGAGCAAGTTITVNSVPSGISGTGTVCIGLTTTLTDATGGGTWSSNTTSTATIGATTGTVTGVAAGTATITYLVSTGCKTTTVVTVNALPGNINGTASVCVGLTTSLSDATAGGAWSSSDGALATIATTGVVTGVASGNPVITYTIGSGCIRTTILTVNPLSSVTGSTPVCVNATVTLADATSGGAWSSSTPSVATVGAGTGIVTGAGAGTATITYLLSTGCKSTAVVTVNAIPGVINGTASACVGLTTSLSDATAGGTWSSSDGSLATIGTTGIVSGIAVGNPVISYTLGTGCMRTVIVTVNDLSSITGNSPVCVSSTLSLADAAIGGAWTSSTTSVATVIGSTGVVTGVASGTSTITYLLGTGCKATTVVTVNPIPGAITGTGNVCVGSTLQLTDATAGGNWSSSNTSQATVSSGGLVTGAGAGIPTISYALGTGCVSTTPVTVNPVPTAITGTMIVCAGSTTNLSNAAAGGTWSSSTTSVATVNASGAVTGVAGSTSTITYTMGAACFSTAVVTINPILPITGLMSACVGSTTTLADGTSGGTWSSSNTLTATIGTSGIVNGVALGTVTISYTILTGCVRTTTVAINATPTSILGNLTACIGYTTTLSDAVAGGTWSAGNIFVATIGAGTGIVTGAGSGTSTISYISGFGCYVTSVVTVNSNPTGIGGSTSVCPGATITLADFTAGGVWSSSNSNATVDGSGHVLGVTAGNSTISYTIPATTCFVTYPITIKPAPVPISGTTSACVGAVTFLSDATTGGISWTSDNTGVATVSGGGGVTGISAGTANITYTISNNCTAMTTVTINPVPVAISSNIPVCVGLSTTLSDGSAGGTWISGNASIATIGSTSGTMTGTGGGTTTVTYQFATGCKVTATVTINAINAITGNIPTCVGTNLILTDATTGGTWSSDNTGVATVGATGVVTGVGTGGTATISYVIPSGCLASVVVTFNQTPGGITGTRTVCLGFTTALTDAVGGGTWSSNAPFIANAGSTGIVTGVLAGTATISYVSGAGCYATALVTVNPQPSNVGGSATVCFGSTITVSDFTAGGTWSSSNSNISIDGSGHVTGLVVGNSVITYTLPTSCYVTYSEQVNPLPTAVNGALVVCVASQTTVTDATTPGLSWTSSNTSVATIINSGVATGVSAGTTVLTYTIPTGCYTTAVLTVNPIPAVPTGNTPVCLGNSITLSDVTASGAWSTTDNTIATIGSASGVVTTVAAGLVYMRYTIATGCYNVALVTVNPIYAITGAGPACLGQTLPLTDAATGGTWSSTDPSVATINSSTGIVTPAIAGTTTISYVLATGCNTASIVTVTAAIADISGDNNTCSLPATLPLSDATPGGLWSSSDPTVATVDGTTGVVSGIADGSVDITYSIGGGCIASITVSVDQSPSALSGANVLCTGLTSALSDDYPDGTWSSNDPTIADVSVYTGLVTGLSNGTTTISYTIDNGCFNTVTVSVDPLVSAISGTTLICIGSTSALTDATTGGTWASSNAAIASVGTDGTVTGISGGSAIVTYTAPTGCMSTTLVVVNPYAGVISGPTNVDLAATISLTDVIGGGSWASSNGHTTVDGSGNVTGVSAGTSVISYTVTNICGSATTTTTITVNVGPAPVVVSGGGTFCGSTTITADNGGDGIIYYQGTNPVGTSTLTPSTSQLITSSGTYYFRALAGGIWGTAGSATVVINPVASSITGTATVCTGSTTNLTDAGGGTWSSSSQSVATVGSATGVISGVATGTATITYTLPTGCNTTDVVTVNPVPAAIFGVATACVGLTTDLADGTAGGDWTSNNGSIATVDISGTVTGVSAGTATITYTLPTGCYATDAVTIYGLPGTISGNASVCQGSIYNFTDATTGGAWSSSDAATASVNALGQVTGVALGTATITYSLGTGCITTQTVTVSSVPSAITGTPVVCVGAATNLTDATAGGSWTSGAAGTATVGSSTGVVSGVAAGVAGITYTMPSGCNATANVTVNALPTTVTASGTGTYCGSTTITASNGGSGTIYFQGITSGGTSTATPGAPQLVSATGTYYFRAQSAGGCWGTEGSVSVTINPLPAAITGTASVCVGLTTNLTDATAGGTWTSSNGSIASVGTTGIVVGVAQGNATITYTLGTGCYVTDAVVVNPLPAAITGTTSICIGATTALSNATIGGNWSSGATGVATIGSATGIATGVAGGVAGITYTLATGCIATTNLNVNALPATVITSSGGTFCGSTTITAANGGDGTIYFQGTTSNGTSTSIASASQLITSSGTYYFRAQSASGCWGTQGSVSVTINPIPAAISGATMLCVGSGYTMSDATAGGAWSSSNTAAATIGTSGNIAALATGTSNISYILGTGCYAATAITVNPLPAGITGTGTVCLGLTTALTDGTAGGAWTSGNTLVATVGSTGIVTGNVSGNAVITYSLGTGCAATTTVTVNPNPSAIIGTTSMCLGTGYTLSDGVAGGNWSSSTGSVATIDGSGNVSTVGTGTSTITYALPTGCLAATVITINPLPGSINGTMTICTGATTTLTDATGSGAWTSGNAGIATVNSSSGLLTGVSAGNASITYTTGAGCYTIATVTINQSPAAITGTLAVCQGLTTALANTVGGGAWVSGATGIATVGTDGVVTGVSGGTASISYTIGGCAATTVVTVNPITAITGNVPVCVNATITLSDATSGGAWSSGSISIASIGTTGIVTGLNAGTSIISYLLPTGCSATTVVTVNQLPQIILGASSVCNGQTITLSDLTTGGNWTSNDGAIATAGSVTGIITGVSAGATAISYTLSTGCYTTKAITVNPFSPIAGSSSLCIGSSVALTDATAGGTWSSSNALVATVGTSGLVTSVAAGTTAISYVLGSGCTSSVIISVNAAPPAISGTLVACVGMTTALSDAGGGAWASGATGVATIGTDGIVTGVASGTAGITYTLPAGCAISAIVTINSVPTTINGTSVFCAGSTSTLTDAITGGIWSSSNTSNATVGLTSGVVTGVAGGTATITYTMAAGCFVTTTVTINPILPITGTLSTCIGSTTTLADGSSGGTWSSSNSTIASVGSASGIVTGNVLGTVTISYAIPFGCVRTATVTVGSVPGSITGTTVLCAGATTTLSDAVTGGTWSTSNLGVATAAASTGVITGVAAGTANVTYTQGSGCIAVIPITVNATPSSIGGASSVCVGSNITLSDFVAGGNWSSSNGNAAVGSTTGIVSGVTAGVSTITYALTSTGCFKTYSITINSVPSAITGPVTVCAGATGFETDATSGGISWSSSNTSVATITNSGAITGVAGGTTTITYTISSGCIATAVVTVNSLAPAITGNAPLCAGSTITLSDALAGGTWTSNNAAIATIGSGTGVVTGVAGGTVLINYLVNGGCAMNTVVTVNALLPITGSTAACVGSSTTLADGTSGGTWSSSTTSVANVGSSSGVVTGVAAGTSVITYATPSGCSRTVTVSISPMTIITGTSVVCVGVTTALTDVTAGGTWSSNAPFTASVGTTGIVTGVAAGTVNITYAVSGCNEIQVVTVNAAPSGIGGSTTVCTGASVTLSNFVAGGTWSSSNGNVTVGSATGVVSGVTAGTTTITYMITATGCFKTYAMTINQSPTAVLGATSVCAGSTAFVSDATSGGVSWTSSNTSVATISGSGAVTGVTAGTTTLTYMITTGCIATAVFTVNVLPVVAAISGANNVSHGSTVTLSDATSSGVWSSANSSIASVGAGTGVVTGVATSGTTTISYSVTNGLGCTGFAVQSMTVHTPAPHIHGTTISGTTTMGAGSAVSITDDNISGLWSSSDNSIATVSEAGIVTGVMPGTANIIHVVTFGDGEVATTVTPIVVTSVFVDIKVVPNPNSGSFVVRGSLGTESTEHVSIRVVDVLGQVIYKNNVLVTSGKLNETIALSDVLANGMYILELHTQHEDKVFHFVIEK